MRSAVFSMSLRLPFPAVKWGIWYSILTIFGLILYSKIWGMEENFKHKDGLIFQLMIVAIDINSSQLTSFWQLCNWHYPQSAISSTNWTWKDMIKFENWKKQNNSVRYTNTCSSFSASSKPIFAWVYSFFRSTIFAHFCTVNLESFSPPQLTKFPSEQLQSFGNILTCYHFVHILRKTVNYC